MDEIARTIDPKAFARLEDARALGDEGLIAEAEAGVDDARDRAARVAALLRADPGTGDAAAEARELRSVAKGLAAIREELANKWMWKSYDAMVEAVRRFGPAIAKAETFMRRRFPAVEMDPVAGIPVPEGWALVPTDASHTAHRNAASAAMSAGLDGAGGAECYARGMGALLATTAALRQGWYSSGAERAVNAVAPGTVRGHLRDPSAIPAMRALVSDLVTAVRLEASGGYSNDEVEEIDTVAVLRRASRFLGRRPTGDDPDPRDAKPFGQREALALMAAQLRATDQNGPREEPKAETNP